MGGVRQRAGIGQVYVWPGGSLWIGKATGATDVHEHHAVQLSLSVDGDLHFRTSAAADWKKYRQCLVPNDMPHAFMGKDLTAAHVFVEPESAQGRRLLETFDGEGIRVLPGGVADEARRLLFTAWRSSRAPAVMVPAAHKALAVLTADVPPAQTTDPRVLGAIEIIRARLDSPITLGEVARALHLSPGRFRHLFVEETGLPFRRYVLWQRLQKVIERAGFASWTDVALEAGFSDAAHMTRTFRRMLGSAPTALERE